MKLIVGIGASAGGLEALECFFKAMPCNSQIAFIVVVHLDPTHVSMLPELIQRHTRMEVVKIQDGMRVEANKIYVIPPNHNLSILNGELQLIMPVSLRDKLPIDYFFRALAQDQGANAACIILSGTGSDGSAGIKEIKAATGMVMVQSIQSARYDGMPQNAIATGLADYILAPQDMPKSLTHYAQHPQNLEKGDPTAIRELPNIVNKILILIRNQTGHDFSLYKKNTIHRRIERRMQIHQIDKVNHYLQYLQHNDQEVNVLFKELLIGVTSFFRDKEAFDQLKQTILPALLENKPDNYTIRIWVPGCSTGEEAYSIAIIVQECLLTLKKHMNVQIFGTDIDESAIEQARGGIYPLNFTADVSPEYCQRYFIKEEHQYRIKKFIRETLVFAIQNLIKDPPFTKLDLVSCRNLLIYFDADLQKKILPIFHYSLKEDGVLFLGSSETTGQSNQYFDILDKKWKFFKRKPSPDASSSNIHFSDSVNPLKMEEKYVPATITQIEELSALQLVESILKQSEMAPCVVIDSRQNIIYVHGRLGRFLEPAEGRGNSHILEMARSSQLKNELIQSIRKVALHKKPVTKKALSIQNDGDKLLVNLTIKPLQNIGSLKGLMLVIFEEIPLTQHNASETIVNDTSPNQQDANRLRQELESTRENLQTTIEELETSNEELKSSNEELQSTNEELQSTNEELETSKEELQSLNEESATVNAELQSHIDELSIINDDIKNLLDSTQVATLFLDTDLNIRRFTPKMTDIIHLVKTDINRPIAHLSSHLHNVRLTDYAVQVLKTLEKTETEVYSEGDRYYRMRILPYRTATNVIDGVVVSFEDITELKKIQLSLQESGQRYKSLFDHCPVAMLEIDITGLAKKIERLEITDVSQLDSYWTCSSGDEKTQLLTHIIALQINDRGKRLFDLPDKKTLFNRLYPLLDIDNFLYHQMRAIVEKKESHVFDTPIHSPRKEADWVEITITIPKTGAHLNFSNTILVISPKERR